MPRLLLPRPAAILVIAVVLSYAGAAIAAAATSPLTGRDALTLCSFVAAAVLSVEMSLRWAWPRARQDRLSRDFLGVWTLPVILLLPPLYVAAMVTITVIYTHLRAGRRSLLKLTYSTAAIGLAQLAANLAHRLLAHHGAAAGWSPAQLSAGAQPLIAILAALAIVWMVNHVLIGGIVVLTSGTAAVGAFFGDREGAVIDAVDLSLGVVAALLWAVSPLLVPFMAPAVLLLQHQVFSNLRRAVRTDLLTDLASPEYWREVGAREVDRARASGGRLAVILVDVDHFKGVNDRHGHLAGDTVLAAVAHTVGKALRPGDLVGRLGGEEFGAVLTGLDLPDSLSAAERVRTQVASVRVRSDRGEWIGVTVSIGVAELSANKSNLTALLDAADRALYEAKETGRNRVRCAAPSLVVDPRAVDLRGAPRDSHPLR